MIRIATKIAIMGLLILFTYVGICLIPTKPYLVYASLLDKQQQLVTLPAPRVVFIGGSGIALGLDSELLEQALKRPVLNMGVNAGLGLRFMLEQVKPWIHAGDLLLIVPEYEHFYGDLWLGDQNLLWALRIQPAMLLTLNRQQIIHLLPELPSFIQQRIPELLHTKADPIYNRNAFTIRGDFVNHLDRAAMPLALYEIADGKPLNQTALTLLMEFRLYAQQRGAEVYLLYPAIAQSFWSVAENRKTIETLNQAILQQDIIRPLVEPVDAVWSDALFFDTVYHLTREGRALRSQKVLVALQPITRHSLASQ